MRPQDRLVTVKRRKGDFASFSVLSNSLLNTSVITAVTKSSMKPQSGTAAIVTYAVVVKKGMEHKSE